MLDEIVVKHSHCVGTVLQPWLNHANMANIVQNKGAAVDNVWAFLDGTYILICRPSRDQRSVFGGHKHCHSLKFQHLMLPCGIVCHEAGPFQGQRHDSFMYQHSGVDPMLAALYQ